MANTYIVVTPFFPSPDNWRGSYCFDFVKALKKTLADWRIEVFMPGKGDEYEIDGITVHRFATRQLPSNVLPFLCRGRNEKSFLNATMPSTWDSPSLQPKDRLRNWPYAHGTPIHHQGLSQPD